MSERLAMLEGTTYEGGEELRKREVEMKALRDEVVANQIKTRTGQSTALRNQTQLPQPPYGMHQQLFAC
eukprot:1658143-Rhodomonas_salina.1